MPFLNSVISNFESKKHDAVIPRYLCKKSDFKPTVLIDVPFRNENERVSKQLLKKLNAFTKENYDFKIVWKTKKVKQLFTLRRKIHILHVKSWRDSAFVNKIT